jgi:hypothetical protein
MPRRRQFSSSRRKGGSIFGDIMGGISKGLSAVAPIASFVPGAGPLVGLASMGTGAMSGLGVRRRRRRGMRRRVMRR